MKTLLTTTLATTILSFGTALFGQDQTITGDLTVQQDSQGFGGDLEVVGEVKLATQALPFPLDDVNAVGQYWGPVSIGESTAITEIYVEKTGTVAQRDILVPLGRIADVDNLTKIEVFLGGNVFDEGSASFVLHAPRFGAFYASDHMASGAGDRVSIHGVSRHSYGQLFLKFQGADPQDRATVKSVIRIRMTTAFGYLPENRVLAFDFNDGNGSRVQPVILEKSLVRAGNVVGSGLQYGNVTSHVAADIISFSGNVEVNGLPVMTRSSNDGSSSASGFAGGLGSIASGDQSIAYGNEAKAYGRGSTAFGFQTIAGDSLLSSGAYKYATAFGRGTEATGTASTAMGYESKSLGTYSTAIGFRSEAHGESSFTSGHYTKVFGDYSFAGGYAAEAHNRMSFAFGHNAYAKGGEFAGQPDYVYNSGAFAFGRYASAIGHSSFAAGTSAKAEAPAAIAMGWAPQATANSAIAIGNGAKALEAHAVSLGHGANANGVESIAMGLNSNASGLESVAIGFNNKATNRSAVAMGRETIAEGYFAHSNGVKTIARDRAQFVIGQYNTPVGTIGVNGIKQPHEASALFIVGNGTSMTSQSNALEVYQNGTTKVKGNLEVSGNITIEAQGDISMGIFE